MTIDTLSLSQFYIFEFDIMSRLYYHCGKYDIYMTIPNILAMIISDVDQAISTILAKKGVIGIQLVKEEEVREKIRWVDTNQNNQK